MFNRDWRADKRALWVRVVTAVSVVASLGLAAGESPAATRPSVRAQIQDGILQITGMSGANKVALGLKPGILVFDGSEVSEHMNLSADSSHVHLFRDVGDVTMDLNALETADVNATGGADTVIANGTDHDDHVRVRSTTTGDVLISGLTPQIQIAGSEPASHTLNINTLAGNDTASVTSGVSGLIQPIIDLGADE